MAGLPKLNYSAMLTPKHDPDCLPSASSSFRSVVSPDCKNRPQEYVDYIMASGTALHSKRHGKEFMFARTPPGLSCGSGIPSGSATPTTSLDGYLIADLSGSPHIYAEDESRILKGLRTGKYHLYTGYTPKL